MKDNSLVKKILIFLAVAFAVFALTYYELSIAVAIVIAVVWALWFDYRAILTSVVPTVIYALCFGKPTMDIVITGVFAVVGTVIGILIRMKAPHRIGAAFSAVSMSGLMLSICLIDAKQANATLLDIMTDGIDMTQFGGLAVEDIEGLAIASIIFQMMFTGGAVYLLAVITSNLLLRFDKNNRLAIKPLAPLPIWILSKNYTLGLLAAVFAIIVVNFTDIALKTTLSCAVAACFAVPLIVQGISTAFYLIARQRATKGGGGLLWFFVIIFTFPVGALLLGIADQFLRFRKNVRLVKQNGTSENQGDTDKSDNKNNDDENRD